MMVIIIIIIIIIITTTISKSNCVRFVYVQKGFTVPKTTIYMHSKHCCNMSVNSLVSRSEFQLCMPFIHMNLIVSEAI